MSDRLIGHVSTIVKSRRAGVKDAGWSRSPGAARHRWNTGAALVAAAPRVAWRSSSILPLHNHLSRGRGAAQRHRCHNEVVLTASLPQRRRYGAAAAHTTSTLLSQEPRPCGLGAAPWSGAVLTGRAGGRWLPGRWHI